MRGAILSFLLLLSIGFSESCTPKTSDAASVSAAQSPQPQQPQLIDEGPLVIGSLQDFRTPLPFNEDVRQGTLSNGLHYYVLPNQRPADRAELRLIVKAGSILEDDDQQGLAHFVEHMAFNGTENYAENELIDYLQSTGAKFGPDLNAYTSFDETVYMLQVRTDSSEILDKGMGILRDWAGGITFSDEEIDKERGVVLSEWRSGLGAQERLRNQTLPVVFANSRYANRLPIGDTTVLKQAPYDALKRFYRDWYRPNLMAVAVVGDIDAEAIEAQIKSLFSDLENPTSPRERVDYNGPSYDKTQIVVASDPEATYSLVQLNYLLPESHRETVGDFREGLVAGLYNQMLGSRFRENTENPDSPYSFAGSGRSGLVGNVDAYSAYALAKPGLIKESLLALLVENKKVLVHGFLASELERAKANVLDASKNAAKEADKTTSDRFARGLVTSFLDNEPLVSAPDRLALTEQLLSGITVEEVNALAKTFLEDRPRAIVITGPTPGTEEGAQQLPTEAEINRTLLRANTTRVEAYVDQTGAEVSIPELMPVAISATEVFDSSEVTIVTLENGIRVAYKQTDFSEDEIIMSALSTGGTNQLSDDQYPTAELMNGIGSAMGLGPFTPSQLQKALAGKSVNVSAFVSDNTERLSGGAKQETLKDLFELVYLFFQEGQYKPELAEAFIGQQRSFIENLDANPQYQFSKVLTEELYGADNPRHQLPSKKMLDEAKPDEAYNLYRARFANATDWQFNFVGNVNPDTLLYYARRYLGNLPSSAPADVARDPNDKLKTGNLYRRFKAGQAPKSNVLLARAGSYKDSERERLLFETMISALNEELRDKLREDLGGVYGVRVSGNTEQKPRPEYFLSISFNAEPERVDELLAATTEVVERLKTEGPKAKTLSSIRTTDYEQMKSSMTSSNSFWIPVLEAAYLYQRNLDQVNAERLKTMLAGISEEDVKTAMKIYFDVQATTKLEVIMDPEE